MKGLDRDERTEKIGKRREGEEVLRRAVRRMRMIPASADGPIVAVALSRLDSIVIQVDELRQVILLHIHQALEATADEGDLRQLCFELGVEYEDLAGPGRGDRIRQLIRSMHNRDRIGDLILAFERMRPGRLL